MCKLELNSFFTKLVKQAKPCPFCGNTPKCSFSIDEPEQNSDYWSYTGDVKCEKCLIDKNMSVSVGFLYALKKKEIDYFKSKIEDMFNNWNNRKY